MKMRVTLRDIPRGPGGKALTEKQRGSARHPQRTRRVSDVDLAAERRVFLHATESSYNWSELIWQASEENQGGRLF